MPRIFISFRKSDSRVMRTRVYKGLEDRFGSAQLFKSGTSIEPGTDFAATLLREASTCEVMLALIGPDWLDAVDGSGQRLIDRPGDWVRTEIATAVRKGNLVIPVLLGDATSLPDPTQLPMDIAALGGRQFVRIPDSNVDAGLDELLSKLTALLPSLTTMDPSGGDRPGTEPTVGPRVGQRGQVATASHGSTAVTAGGDVKIVGRDDRSRITNKKGMNAVSATAVGASGGIGSWLLARKPLALLGWVKSHQLLAGITLLAVGGLTVGVIMVPNGDASSGGQPAKLLVASTPPVVAPATSPAPALAALTSGAQVTQSDNPLGSWADGSLLAVLTSTGSPGTSATVSVYDTVAGNELGTYQPATLLDPEDGCVIGLYKRHDGSSILLMEYDLITPAQGINSGSQVEQFVAADPRTGRVLWTSPLPPYGTPPGANDQSIQDCTNAVSSSASDRPELTTDGSYLLWGGGIDGYLVNLETGKVTQSKNGYEALGQWIAIEVGDDQGPNGASTAMDLTNPETGAVQGEITDSEALDVMTGDGGQDDSSAVTPDGTTLLTIESVQGVKRLEAIDLPSGRLLWSKALTTGDEDSLAVDPDTGTAFLFSSGSFGAALEITTFQPRSGSPGSWSITGEFCGASRGHVYVVANSELAVLDEAQGSQISYDPTISTCPQILDGVVVKGTDFLAP